MLSRHSEYIYVYITYISICYHHYELFKIRTNVKNVNNQLFKMVINFKKLVKIRENC